MLMPPRSSAPFCRCAPERRLPVWPGWMPTPVEALLNRPVTKFIFVLNGAIGSRLLLSSMSAPLPLAHQWLALTPFAINSAAKRFGQAAAAPVLVIVSLPHTGRDSSHG